MNRIYQDYFNYKLNLSVRTIAQIMSCHLEKLGKLIKMLMKMNGIKIEPNKFDSANEDVDSFMHFDTYFSIGELSI